MRSIWWVRDDLRLHDISARRAAAMDGEVIAVHVDEMIEGRTLRRSASVTYLLSKFFRRLCLGTFFELLARHVVDVNFPGRRRFLVLPFDPIVRMDQGVRMCFLVFPIVGCLLGSSAPETSSSALTSQAASAATSFIVVSSSSAVNQLRRSWRRRPRSPFRLAVTMGDLLELDLEEAGHHP